MNLKFGVDAILDKNQIEKTQIEGGMKTVIFRFIDNQPALLIYNGRLAYVLCRTRNFIGRVYNRTFFNKGSDKRAHMTIRFNLKLNDMDDEIAFSLNSYDLIRPVRNQRSFIIDGISERKDFLVDLIVDRHELSFYNNGEREQYFASGQPSPRSFIRNADVSASRKY